MSALPAERVTALALLAVEQEVKIELAAAALAKAKADYIRTTMEDLPELMKELELVDITLTNGTKVAVRGEVSCSITEANRDAAHAWLKKNGFGGLIKTELTVSFGKNEDELVAEAKEALEEALSETDHAPTVKEVVHPATLKSFIKEQMEAGATPPVGLFSIFPYDVAIVVPPKPPKAPKPRKAKSEE